VTRLQAGRPQFYSRQERGRGISFLHGV